MKARSPSVVLLRRGGDGAGGGQRRVCDERVLILLRAETVHHDPTPTPQAVTIRVLIPPPYRVQGLSVAGEETVIQVPELDVCFDIGLCPRPALASPYVALTHGHMDHAAGLAYYYSQRHFQGMGVGTVVCHMALAQAVENMMNSLGGPGRAKRHRTR